MLTGALILAWTLCQEPKIDFTVRATSLGNVLGKLSNVAGIKLRVEPAMAGEIVCIDAHQVTLVDLMERLAAATSCEWKEDNGARILFRPTSITRQLRDAEIRSQTESLQRLFERNRADLAKVGTPSDRAEALVKAIKLLEAKAATNPRGMSLDGPRLAAPESTLTLQLAMNLEPRILGELLDGQSITFSNIPTSAQKPLGPNAQHYIDDYVDAETHLAGILPKRSSQSITKGLIDDIYEAAESPAGIGKILLKVTRMGRVLTMSTAVYNGAGKTRGWGFANSLTLGDDLYREEALAGTKEPPEWIEIPARTAELVAHLEPEPDYERGSFGAALRPWSALPTASRDILENPESIDPLALMTTDGCFALSEKQAAPMVAYLGDIAERAGRLSIKDGRLNLTRFKALMKLDGEETANDQGWMVIRPRNPLSAVRNRLSRPALGAFMRAMDMTKRIDLEPLARFHFAAGRAIVASSVERLYRKTFLRFGVATSHQGAHSHEAFAALGSIDDDQWRELGHGNAVRIGESFDPQHTIIEKWMENGQYFLQVDPAAHLPDLMSDYTEYAPNGLPGNALLLADSHARRVIRPYTKIRDLNGQTTEQGFGTQGQTPAEMASVYAKGGYYKSFEQVMADMKRSKFEVAKRTDIFLKLQVLPTHLIDEEFLGPPTEVQILTYNNWPESMRQEFETTFKREMK